MVAEVLAGIEAAEPAGYLGVDPDGLSRQMFHLFHLLPVAAPGRTTRRQYGLRLVDAAPSPDQSIV